MTAMDITTMKQTNPAHSMATRDVPTLLGGLTLFLAAWILPGCTSSPEPALGASPEMPAATVGHGPGMMMGGRGMMMGGSSMMMGGPGTMGQTNVQRRSQAAMGGVPAPYGGLTDPLPNTPATVAMGKRLYTANCAACHGASGEGDGPAAAGLSPAPSNLRALAHSPAGRDDYLMWAISAGGGAYGTAMPAFKDSLPEDARWQIVRYLETL